MLRLIRKLPSAIAYRLPLSFRVLYRVFVMRLIDLELLSSDGDPSRLMGQFASVFGTISFFCTFPVPYILWGKKPLPVPAMWMFEHFLIETTMTVAGLITVLSWDSAFPDRRDMLVLGPLPVRARTLFISKLAALFAAPSLAIIAFNFFAGFGWPMVFAVGLGSDFSLLRTLPVYWLTVFAAGAFFVFTVLALQGLAANLLPRQLFLRLSDAFQAVALCVLLCSYLLGPSLNSPAALAAPQNQAILRWLPAYWFLGLFNQLNGSMHPELVPLAHRAWMALGISAAGAFVALLLSYFRMLPRIVEQPDILPAIHTRSLSFGNSLANAVTLFSLRTLLRSRRHRMVLSVYVGLGIAIVLGFTHIHTDGLTSAMTGIHPSFLLATILAMTLSVLAFRVVVGIPITLPANWIFRTTQARPMIHYQRAVRVSWIILIVAPVLLLSGAFSTANARALVLGHLVILLFFGFLLVELCLLSFRKISFTCSYLPGKGNLHFIFWGGLSILALWFKDLINFESRILHQPRAFVLLLLVLLDAIVAVYWLNRLRLRSDVPIVFDQEAEPEMVTLKFD